MDNRNNEIAVRIVLERTFNLGNFNSKKIGIEIIGDINEVKKYKEIEPIIKSVVDKIGKTIEEIKGVRNKVDEKGEEWKF